MPGGRSDAYRKQLSGMPRSKLGKLVKSAGLAVSCRAVRPPCNPNEVTSAEALGPRYLVFQPRVHLLAQCRIHCPTRKRNWDATCGYRIRGSAPKSQGSAACDNLVAAAYFARHLAADRWPRTSVRSRILAWSIRAQCTSCRCVVQTAALSSTRHCCVCPNSPVWSALNVIRTLTSQATTKLRLAARLHSSNGR
jgi:hypothetical protein